MRFLSTLSLRRATRQHCRNLHRMEISIHALLAESDYHWLMALVTLRIFLSTLSLRRATGRLAGYDAGNQNFYPRSPCGERRRPDQHRDAPPKFLSTLSLRRATFQCSHGAAPLHISIHALLAESDAFECKSPAVNNEFLSTLSLRRATGCGLPQCHAGCDFYPRSPCGERPAPGHTSAWKCRISIHALLAESDLERFRACKRAI